jgi:hypothetical protein
MLLNITEDVFRRYHMFVTPLPDVPSALRNLKSYEATAPTHFLGACAKEVTASRYGLTCPVQAHTRDRQARASSLCMVVLDATSLSITVAWGRAIDSNDFIQKLLGAEGDPESAPPDEKGVGMVDIGVRASRDQQVSPWVEVYSGCGSGCRIDNLEPGTCYHIRLRTLAAVSIQERYNSGDHENVQHRSRFCPQGGAVYIKASTTEESDESGGS